MEDRPFDGQNTSHAVRRILNTGEQRDVFTKSDDVLPEWDLDDDNW